MQSGHDAGGEAQGRHIELNGKKALPVMPLDPSGSLGLDGTDIPLL